VIFDPHCITGADLQAMDRAHRMGQAKDVNVHRFIAKGTIEGTEYLRQMAKQQHANIDVDGSTAERRTFDGYKPDETNKGWCVCGGGTEIEVGELWGLRNLIEDSVDKERTLDLLGPGAHSAGGSYYIKRIPLSPGTSLSLT